MENLHTNPQKALQALQMANQSENRSSNAEIMLQNQLSQIPALLASQNPSFQTMIDQNLGTINQGINLAPNSLMLNMTSQQNNTFNNNAIANTKDNLKLQGDRQLSSDEPDTSIAQYERNENSNQISTQLPELNIPGFGLMTVEQDKILFKLGRQLQMDWKRISKQMFGRNIDVKLLKERYNQILRLKGPIKPKRYSHKEDLMIAKYFDKYGTNWEKVCEHFEDHTPTMLKNRFYATLRKKDLITPLLSEVVSIEKNGAIVDDLPQDYQSQYTQIEPEATSESDQINYMAAEEEEQKTQINQNSIITAEQPESKQTNAQSNSQAVQLPMQSLQGKITTEEQSTPNSKQTSLQNKLNLGGSNISQSTKIQVPQGSGATQSQTNASNQLLKKSSLNSNQISNNNTPIQQETKKNATNPNTNSKNNANAAALMMATSLRPDPTTSQTSQDFTYLINNIQSIPTTQSLNSNNGGVSGVSGVNNVANKNKSANPANLLLNNNSSNTNNNANNNAQQKSTNNSSSNSANTNMLNLQALQNLAQQTANASNASNNNSSPGQNVNPSDMASLFSNPLFQMQMQQMMANRNSGGLNPMMFNQNLQIPNNLLEQLSANKDQQNNMLATQAAFLNNMQQQQQQQSNSLNLQQANNNSNISQDQCNQMVYMIGMLLEVANELVEKVKNIEQKLDDIKKHQK